MNLVRIGLQITVQPAQGRIALQFKSPCSDFRTYMAWSTYRRHEVSSLAYCMAAYKAGRLFSLL